MACGEVSIPAPEGARGPPPLHGRLSWSLTHLHLSFSPGNGRFGFADQFRSGCQDHRAEEPLAEGAGRAPPRSLSYVPFARPSGTQEWENKLRTLTSKGTGVLWNTVWEPLIEFKAKENTLSNYWKPGALLSALELWVPHDCPLSLGSIPGLG